MPTLGWTRMRRVLEYIGRRPITTVWIGLQLNLILYWRASEPYPYTAFERFSQGMSIVLAISLLNIPGIWVISPFVGVVDAFLASRGSSGSSETVRDVIFLTAWLMSAVVTFVFWRRSVAHRTGSAP